MNELGLRPLGDVKGKECAVVRDSSCIALQFVLLLVALTFLVVKWRMENQRRSRLIFAMDASKQLVSLLAVQLLNIALSSVTEATSAESADECAIFWSFVVASSTLGLSLNILMLLVSERILSYDSGVYGDCNMEQVDTEGNPVEVTRSCLRQWTWQVVVFMWCVSMAQLIMYFLMSFTMPFWERLGDMGVSWIVPSRARLVYVMVASPLIGYTLAVYALDAFIMRTPSGNARQELPPPHSSSGLQV